MKKERLIYALCCPFTDNIHYIGKTTVGMSRPLQHATKSHSVKVKEWVESIKEIGHGPVVRILETVASEDVDAQNPLVLSVDGKGIVMRTDGLREATRKAAERDQHKRKARLAPGEKSNRKRMATVATVYSVAPHVRTAEHIMGLEERQGKPPRAQNKRVWASLERDMSDVIEDQFREALRRDPEKRRPWVVLLDGNLTQLGLVESAIESMACQPW